MLHLVLIQVLAEIELDYRGYVSQTWTCRLWWGGHSGRGWELQEVVVGLDEASRVPGGRIAIAQSHNQQM